MSDIVRNDEFDPTTPMTTKIVPFPGDNVISNPVSQNSLLSNIVQPFSGDDYAELGAIIGMLEGMTVFFQTLHWKMNGKTFYGDHLMFQRIYESFAEPIDSIAEKAVAFGSIKLVDHEKIVRSMDLFLNHLEQDLALKAASMGPEMDDTGYQFAKRGQYVLDLFIKTTEKIMSELKEKGKLSKGLDNLLAGILDTQEGNVYLLKQRTRVGF